MIKGILTKAGLGAVRLYRIAISPYHEPVCRFVPTCSSYAEEALRRHGFFRGGFMALKRVLRCHPFSHGGYDPVR